MSSVCCSFALGHDTLQTGADNLILQLLPLPRRHLMIPPIELRPFLRVRSVMLLRSRGRGVESCSWEEELEGAEARCWRLDRDWGEGMRDRRHVLQQHLRWPEEARSGG